jgi:hypothetical protein
MPTHMLVILTYLCMQACAHTQPPTHAQILALTVTDTHMPSPMHASTHNLNVVDMGDLL